MSEISASLVKELRERTGMGMMDCKQALVTTKGDISLAIEELRKFIKSLHATYNVAKVYVTSDHGFLYSDNAIQDKNLEKIDETNTVSTPDNNISPGDVKRIPAHSIADPSAKAIPSYPPSS